MTMKCSLTIIGLTILCMACLASEYDYELIVNRKYMTPDCVEKLMLAINDQVPGPPIRVTPGQVVRIKVYNALPSESITFHWHGQHQSSTPFMDGISKISQCPIAPKSYKIYTFTVNARAGTYFYHAHIGALIEGGAYGPFIVEDASQTYDGEFTLMAGDHYHRPTYSSLFNLLSAADGAFRWVFDPNSILINGKSVYNCLDNADYTCDTNDTTKLCTQIANSVTYHVCGAHQRDYTRFRAYGSGGCDSDECGYEEFEVTKGNTYLFRFINPSPLSHLNIKMEKHNMTVVALDGYPVEPIMVDSVDLHSGQRVDVEVEMNGEASEVYWITAKIRGRSGVKYGPAILKYSGSADGQLPTDVTYDALSQPDWDDYAYTRDQQNAYIGLDNPPSDNEVEQRFVLLGTQERFDLANQDYSHNPDEDLFTPNYPNIEDAESIIGFDGNRPEDNCDSQENTLALRWAINRETFMPPNTPALHQNVFQTDKFEQMAAQHPLTYMKVETGKVYDLIFQNYPACSGVCETHSMHLHGHSFWVLGNFKGQWNASQAQQDALCKEKCPRRDTVFLLPDKTSYGNERQGCGYTVVRFRANSPGVWSVHCHQSWHFMMGHVALIYYDASEIAMPADVGDVGICGDLNAMDVALRFMPNETESASVSSDESTDGAMGMVVGKVVAIVFILSVFT